MNFEKAASGLFLPVKDMRDWVADAFGSGRYHCTLIREGEIIDEWETKNVVTNQGLTAMVNIMLAGGAQITSWYLGLFTGNYTPVGTDVAATFPTNASEATGYTAGARQQFVPTTPTSPTVGNAASRASFTFNGSQTIYGAFLSSSGVISGTSGTLFSAAQYSAPKPVVDLDQLLCSYAFSLASA